MDDDSSIWGLILGLSIALSFGYGLWGILNNLH